MVAVIETWDAARYGVGQGGDDTALINGLIDAAAADPFKKAVELPAGTILADGIVIKTGVTLRGQGVGQTIIKKNGTGPSAIESENYDALVAAPVLSPAPNSFTLTGFTVDGDSQGTSTGAGVRLYGHGFRIPDLHIQYCTGWGLETEFSPASTGGVLEPAGAEADIGIIKIEHCTGGGWRHDGPHDSHVGHVLIWKCAAEALRLDPNSDGTLFDIVHCWSNEHTRSLVVESSGVSIGQLIAAGADAGDGVNVEVLGSNFRCTNAWIFQEPTKAGVGLKLGDSASGAQAHSVHFRGRISNFQTAAVDFNNIIGVNTIVADVFSTDNTAPTYIGTLPSRGHFEFSNEVNPDNGLVMFGPEPIGFFGTAPASQQTASSTSALWDAMKAYGLLDAASSAPETPITTHTWNTPAGPLAVGDRGENFIVPEGGVIEQVAVIADTLTGTDFTVELINASAAFGTNPSVTVTTAGVVVAFGPGTQTVSDLDVIYPQITAINGTALEGVTVSVKIRHT